MTNRLWCFIGLPSDGQHNWNGRGVANNLVPPGPPLSPLAQLYAASAPPASLLSGLEPRASLLSDSAPQFQSGLGGDVVLWGFIGGSSWCVGSVEGRPLGQTTVGADCDGGYWTCVPGRYTATVWMSGWMSG